MSNIVRLPDNRTKRVSSLDWLRRRLGKVVRVEVSPHAEGDAVAYFLLDDKRTFITEFADQHVLWDYLQRTNLVGCPVYWGDDEYTIGPRKGRGKYPWEEEARLP